jgi:hypothetical protein
MKKAKILAALCLCLGLGLLLSMSTHTMANTVKNNESSSPVFANHPVNTSADIMKEKLDPWEIKPVLSYLFCTQDSKIMKDIADLQSSLKLSDEEMNTLKLIAEAEMKISKQIKENSDYLLSDNASSDKNDIAKKSAQIALVEAFNSDIDRTVKNTDVSVRNLLGEKYPEFRDWLKAWFASESAFRAEVSGMSAVPSTIETASAAPPTYTGVYATQQNW